MTEKYKIIDLFAGIGGIRLGFTEAGCECVLTSEIDAHAQKVYFDNFNELALGDITKIKSEDIPDFDILCGGFPCQPFSMAGHRKGFEDTRGTLFFEVARIIKDKQPQAFFLENVKNLESHDGGKTFEVIRQTLEDLGYSFYHQTINAKLIVPQNRERVFMIGFKDRTLHYQFPYIEDLQPKAKDILEQEVDEKYTHTDKGWAAIQRHAARHKEKGNGFGYGLVDFESYTRTISARYYKDGSEILVPQNGKNPRKLTPRECARLQGYPESFKITSSDTQAYKQFGNSVCVPLIAILAKSIVKTFDEKPLLNEPYSAKRQLSLF